MVVFFIVYVLKCFYFILQDKEILASDLNNGLDTV